MTSMVACGNSTDTDTTTHEHESSSEVTNTTEDTHNSTENGSDDTASSDSNSTESATNNTDTTDQTDRDEGNETESTGEESTENTEADTNEPTTDEPTSESTEDVQPTEDNGEPPSHAHEYTEKVTNPTCTTGGYTTYTCDCGDTYKGNETSATGHSFGDWVTTKEPTETATGTAERVCKDCNHKENKVLDKIVPNHTHKYASTTTKKATCTEEGVLTYTCSCGSSYTEKIAKTNHNYTDNKVAATCTTAGYTSHTCKTCGYSYKDGNVAALGHSYNDKVTAPTCTEQGYTTHTCKTCGNTYKDAYVKANGHSWSGWTTTKEPTTTSIGSATRKCNSCGTTETKTLDKLAESHKHSYTASITKKATCTENGIKTFACSCGHSYTEGIEKTGHNYTSSVVAPTCTAKGYTKFVCGNCGDNYTSNEVAATGHSYQFTSDTATCSAAGVKTETCGKCGNVKTSTSAAKGCTNLNTETVNGNCTEDGYTKVTCGDCGTVISNTTIPASGDHQNETVNLVEAITNSPYIMAMGRYISFEDMVVDRCKVCGYFDPEKMYYPGTTRDIAEQMLSYVNELRRTVYGTNEYDMVCDDTLIELANIRAKEIVSHFSHVGDGVTYTGAGENIIKGYSSVKRHFTEWSNSSGHYQNMIDKDYKYFGYAFYRPYGDTGLYGVQLFWTDYARGDYMRHHANK